MPIIQDENAAAAVIPVSGAVVGKFTRDLTTASGTQSITGLSIDPNAIIILGGQGSTVKVSWGVSDGTNEQAVSDNNLVSSDTYATDNADTIFLIQGAGVTYAGSITFTSGGFDIAWVRTGTPNGVATLNYIALELV